MRIALISDLHLSVHSPAFPAIAADVLVLAGDIARPARAIEWARASTVPTLYVAGNHEFYGSDLVTTYEQLGVLSKGTCIRLLERTEWKHNGVRFLGCTLWSDFRIFESDEARDSAVTQALSFTRDYSHIRVSPDFPALFSPPVAQLLFLQSVTWLDECFSRPHEGPTVVITHFAPSLKSISAKFIASPLNACFVSDLEDKIQEWQPTLWLHGHTHDSFDYRVGNTRVVCNARGYAKDGIAENPSFDPSLVIELDNTCLQ